MGEEGNIDIYDTWKNIQNGCAKKYGNIPMHIYALLCILMLYATRHDLQTHTLLSPGNSRPTTSATTPRWMLALATVIGEKRYTS